MFEARWYAGNLMVVALADMAGLQKVASFTLNNLFQPGDTIHTTFVEDTANSGRLPVSHPPSLANCILCSSSCLTVGYIHVDVWAGMAYICKSRICCSSVNRSGAWRLDLLEYLYTC